jgi:hypothetical protein
MRSGIPGPHGWLTTLVFTLDGVLGVTGMRRAALDQEFVMKELRPDNSLQPESAFHVFSVTGSDLQGYGVRHTRRLRMRVRFLVSTMHTGPRTSEGWWGFVLFPFKAYVVLAYISARICTLLAPRTSRREAYSFVVEEVIYGFAVCFVVFTIATVVQLVLHKRSAAANSAFFAALSLMLGWYLLPPFATA